MDMFKKGKEKPCGRRGFFRVPVLILILILVLLFLVLS
jgi:hypothetical protein